MKLKTLFLCFGLCFLATTLLLSFFFSHFDGLLVFRPVLYGDAPTTVIILDAGHGGEDGGATGTNGVLEKDLNLTVTHALADLLRMAGHTVIETRTDDRLLYDQSTTKGHKKRDDLKNRLAFAEQYPDSIFISLHMNTFPSNTCHGTQVWYSENNEGSRELASAVQDAVVKALQPENKRKIKAATSSIYLLRHARCPSILIECGFLSTPSDCERLCDPRYQKQLVAVLFSVISQKMQEKS